MKKYNKILDIIITVCSVFIFINYFSYLIKLFIWSEGTLPYVIAFSVIIFIPLLAVLHRRGILAKLFRGSYTALRSIYAFGLAFYMVSFVILCAFILGDEVSQPTVNELPQNTYIITLGAKVNSDGTPGKILAKRLKTTYEILAEREDLLCIVSGGQGADEPISEALCMKNYLVSRGIDEDRIILEDKASNTIENIKNSRELIDRRGGSGAIGVVTTNFHIPRAKYICSRLGVDGESTYYFSAPDTGKYTLYTILVREYMSYIKLFVLGT